MQFKHVLILFAFLPLFALGQIPNGLDTGRVGTSPFTAGSLNYTGKYSSNQQLGAQNAGNGKWFTYFTGSQAYKAFNDTLKHGLNYFQIRGNNGLLNSQSYYLYSDNTIHWQQSEFDSKAKFLNGIQIFNSTSFLSTPDAGYGLLGFLNNSLKAYSPNGTLFTVADSAIIDTTYLKHSNPTFIGTLKGGSNERILLGTRVGSVGKISVEGFYTIMNEHTFDDYSTINSTSVSNLGYGIFDASTKLSGTTDNAHFMAYQARQTYTGSGILGTGASGLGMAGLYYHVTHNGTGRLVSGAGVYIDDIQGTGPVTQSYGVWVQDITRGSNGNFAFYSGKGKVHLGDTLNGTLAGFTGFVQANTFIKTGATSAQLLGASGLTITAGSNLFISTGLVGVVTNPIWATSTVNGLSTVNGIAAPGNLAANRINGTLLSPTPVLANDITGLITFGGQYDTSVGHVIAGGEMYGQASGDYSGTSNKPTDLVFATAPSGSTMTEGMRLTSTGKLILARYPTAGVLHTIVTTGAVASSLIATADVAANAITYAKLQAVTTNKLLGSGTGTSVAEITLGSGLSFSGTTLNSTGSGGTVTSVTPGYGFTSSTPITTSGTLVIDTTILATKANSMTLAQLRTNYAILARANAFSGNNTHSGTENFSGTETHSGVVNLNNVVNFNSGAATFFSSGVGVSFGVTGTPTGSGYGIFVPLSQATLPGQSMTYNGTGVPSLWSGTSIILSSIASISATTTASTLLFTVPSGQRVIITNVNLVSTAATGVSVGPTYTVTASSSGTIVGTQTTGLTATGKTYLLPITGASTAVQSGETISINITAATGASETLTAYLMGYYY